MTVKERILAIELQEKEKKNQQFYKEIGLEIKTKDHGRMIKTSKKN